MITAIIQDHPKGKSPHRKFTRKVSEEAHGGLTGGGEQSQRNKLDGMMCWSM